MDFDDSLPRKSANPAAALAAQDLERLSIDELEARIDLLEREIQRTRDTIASAVNRRASAESLFRR